MTRSVRAAAVLLAAGSLCLLSSSPAGADQGPPGGSFGGSGSGTSGDVDGDTLSATAGVVFDRSKNGAGPAAGPVTASTSWTPPACWYAPKYTPDQLKAYLEPIWEAESTGYEWDAEQRGKYLDKEDPTKDFNKDRTGKGYWWGSYVNKSFPPGWDKCNADYFWVDAGDPPPPGIVNAVTPEILAELAYAAIRVPTTEVTLAPAGATKVNLPTWAWLDGADFKPVSVTASVPVLGISATTTATPVSLKIDPGTPDAEAYPASGVCEIAGGRIGEPYEKGKADRTPPCGVRYLRSSGDASFTLRATVTWKITWTGTNSPGGTLPDGSFGAPQNVIVQEIQAVNR